MLTRTVFCILAVVTVTGTGPCKCGRTAWRFRITGRTDDMFNVRGVNVFPGAVRAIIVRVLLYSALSLGPMALPDFGSLLESPHPVVESVAGPLPGLDELVASVASAR